MANFCTECGKSVSPNAHFCTNCGASLTGSKASDWSGKRQKVLGKQVSSRRLSRNKILMLSFVVIFGAWAYMQLPKGGNPIIEAQPVLAAPAQYPMNGQSMFDIPSRVESGKIIIPFDVLRENKFVAFNYVSPTNTVPLLAYVSGEGKIVTAVSMCEPCNSKRFHIKGEEFICNSCGTTWELNDLEAISGACGKYPPDAVPNVVVGSEIQIDEATVASWQRRI